MSTRGERALQSLGTCGGRCFSSCFASAAAAGSLPFRLGASPLRTPFRRSPSRLPRRLPKRDSDSDGIAGDQRHRGPRPHAHPGRRLHHPQLRSAGRADSGESPAEQRRECLTYTVERETFGESRASRSVSAMPAASGSRPRTPGSRSTRCPRTARESPGAPGKLPDAHRAALLQRRDVHRGRLPGRRARRLQVLREAK